MRKMFNKSRSYSLSSITLSENLMVKRIRTEINGLESFVGLFYDGKGNLLCNRIALSERGLNTIIWSYYSKELRELNRFI